MALRFCVKRLCSTRKVVDRQDAACPRGSRLSTCRALSLKDCTRRGPWTATCRAVPLGRARTSVVAEHAAGWPHRTSAVRSGLWCMRSCARRLSMRESARFGGVRRAGTGCRNQSYLLDPAQPAHRMPALHVWTGWNRRTVNTVYITESSLEG